VALVALLGITLIEVDLALSAPAALRTPVLALAVVTFIGAALQPWRTTLAIAVLWPLLFNLRDSALMSLPRIDGLEPFRRWFDGLPPYPFLSTVLVTVGLVWAWRALAGRRRLDPWPRDSLGQAVWLWACVIAMGTVVGLAALNPILTDAFRAILAAEHWSWLMAPDLDSLHPLAAGRAAGVVLLFFVVVRSTANTPERRRALIRAFLASALLVSVFAIFQFFHPDAMLADRPTWQRDRRVTGPLRDPNSCGTLLSAAALLALTGLVGWWAGRGREGPLWPGVARALGLATICTALVMTGSRVAWFVTPLAMGGWFAVRWRLIRAPGSHRGGDSPEPTLPGWRSVCLFCGGLWLVALLWPAQPPPAGEERNPFHRRFEDTLNWIGGASDTEMRSGLAGRRHHWETAWSLVREHPLWGNGLGTVRILYDAHRGPDNPHRRENTHSQPLQTAAESGIIGLGVLCAVIALALRGGAFAGGPARRQFGGPALALIGFLLTSLTGHPLVLPELQLAFWLLVALCVPRPDPGPHAVAPAMRSPALPTGSLSGLLAAAVLITGVVRVGTAVAQSRRLPHSYGLYEVFSQGGDGVPFIWARQRAALTLLVERPHLMLPIRAGHPDVSVESPVVVTVQTDGTALERLVLTDGSWQLRVLDLHPWIGQTVALEIVTDRHWLPAALGSPDHRALSVALGPWEWLDTELIADPPNVQPWAAEDLP
jgi:hypothetical protein